MIVGSADPEELGRTRPTVASLPRQSFVLDDVVLLQAFYEMPRTAREPVLPPGLHPTNPAALVLQVWRCGDSPWGPFALAQARVQCRSGLRARGFVTGAVCEGSDATRALRDELGFPVRDGRVELQRGYDRVLATVEVDDRQVFEIEGEDPDPLSPGDLQYSSTLTLAHLPTGLRLVQIEPQVTLERAERVRPRLLGFDPSALGEPRLEPTHPVSGSIATGRIEIPPVRFVCRPAELAFTGTEKVEG